MAIAQTPLHPIKTKGMQMIERQLGEPLEAALRRLYVDEKLDQKDIGAMWGLDRATISRWLRDFGIHRLNRA